MTTARSPAREAWDRAQAERDKRRLDLSRRWLERALRLAPDDGLAQLALGALFVEIGEPDRAAPLLAAVAHDHGAPDAWIALAACELARGQAPAARAALERALQSTRLRPALADLAARVVTASGAPGWCGLDPQGAVRTGPSRPTQIRLDGRLLSSRKLPPNWEQAHQLDVAGPAGPFVGSPLPIPQLSRTLGFIEASGRGIRGWLWSPADPDHTPSILIRGRRQATTLTVADPADGIDDLPPLARPRRFSLSEADVAALGPPLAVTTTAGRPLLGSPLSPAVALDPQWADTTGGPPAHDLRDRPIAIVIPVHDATRETLACLDSVLANTPAHAAIHVVDDASQDPALLAHLAALTAAGRIHLHRHPANRGFPSAANTGLAATPGHDVVLLNSDTLVPPDWLDRLRRAAYAAPDIGTATPLSNDATIVSYPIPDAANPPTDPAPTDAIAQRANPAQTADLPVGVGFCLFLRRDCLDQTGPFRDDLFAQGYGEENDVCLRARHIGWRHVAALDVFVTHAGGRSFPHGRASLRRRNAALLNRLYPGYDALIAAHLEADPLFPARRRMDAIRWAADRAPNGAVLLITHAEGGGVNEFVTTRAAFLRTQGLRPVILRPTPAGAEIDGYPNLRYSIPGELADLIDLLRPDHPHRLETHHLLGHDYQILEIARALEIPIDTWIHDAAHFCPRISLIGRNRHYCGEPDRQACEDCIADLGSHLGEPISVPAHLARSAAELAASRRVVAPTADTAHRLRRHFPAVTVATAPWEDDSTLPAPAPLAPAATAHICIVGAIGVEKGYDVLLACVRDAHRRCLPLEFTIVGYTEDDTRLLDAGPIFITGPYDPADAVALIRDQAAHLAFIPSIWPETWCFALSRAWQAGLQAVAFDLGAPAERIRARGHGHLLPLNLPPPAINDALLRLASALGALHCPQP